MRTERPSLLALLRESLSGLRARPAMSVVGSIVALLVGEGILYLPMRAGMGMDVSLQVVLPLLTAFIYLFISNSSDGTQRSLRAILERLLERAWAVIVIDLALSVLQGISMAPGSFLYALVLVPFIAATIYADVSATLDDGISTLHVLPHAIMRSLALAMRAKNFGRMCLLLAAQFAAQATLLSLAGVLPKTLRDSVIIALAIIIQIFIAAMTACMYVEASTATP